MERIIETEIEVKWRDTLGDSFDDEGMTEKDIEEMIERHIEEYAEEHGISVADIRIIK